MTSLRLTRIAPGQYSAHDGRYLIEKADDFERDCECVTCREGYTDHVVLEAFWHVWDTAANGGRGDYAEGSGPGEFETRRAAVAWLASRR